jgi:hypothetical protein
MTPVMDAILVHDLRNSKPRARRVDEIKKEEMNRGCKSRRVEGGKGDYLVV